MSRRGILQVVYGRESFRKFVLSPGQAQVVGRGERADIGLPRDAELSNRHFEILWDGIVAQLRCVGRNEQLKLDGQPALRGEVKNGGVIDAGGSVLRFFVEEATPGFDTRLSQAASKALDQLAPLRAKRHLYGVFDSARDGRIITLLNESIDAHASLYEGGRALDDVAPYLVRFEPDSQLLERLLASGWGEAWGLFIASPHRPILVRRALRRLLLVRAPNRTDRLYFRFYDPRVLRRFIPISTVRQRSELTADMEALLYEGEDASLCRLDAEVAPSSEDPS